jgi:hypothetical protein
MGMNRASTGGFDRLQALAAGLGFVEQTQEFSESASAQALPFHKRC